MIEFAKLRMKWDILWGGRGISFDMEISWMAGNVRKGRGPEIGTIVLENDWIEGRRSNTQPVTVSLWIGWKADGPVI